MVKFTANTAELKKSLSIVALAVGKITNHIQSHALFSIIGDQCHLGSTDEDKVAESLFLLSEVEGGDIQFTADPKNMMKLLTSTDSAETDFTYEPETKTLKVFTSKSKKSFLSFASLNPEKFLMPNLELQELKHTVITEVFLDGIKFAQGFINEKDEKFSNIYITNGVFFGANGNTKVGAFASPDMRDAPNLALRKTVLSSIASMVEKADITEIAIKTSEKLITFSSPDNSHTFGFRKSTAVTPSFPIKTDPPALPMFNVDRILFQKKLNRLSLTSWEDVGLKMTIKDQELEMETVGERPSIETLPCKCEAEEPIEFIIQCNKFKQVLGLYKASNVDVYVAKGRCTLYSVANIEIEEEGKEEPVNKSFTAVGLMTLARLIKENG